MFQLSGVHCILLSYSRVQALLGLGDSRIPVTSVVARCTLAGDAARLIFASRHRQQGRPTDCLDDCS